MNTKLDWELKTAVPALNWPPGWDICSIDTRAPGKENSLYHRYTLLILFES